MLDQFGIGRVAVVGIFLQHAVDRVGRLRRNIRGEGLETHRLAFDLLECNQARALRLERRTARDGVKERASKTVDVAAEILRLVVQPLGRDVVRRAPNFPPGPRFVLQQAGQTEIHDLRGVGVGKEDVAGFDIAVNQPLLRSGLQSLRDLRANFEHLRFRYPGLDGHEVIQRSLLDQFHREIKLSGRLAEGKNAHRVRMVDRGGHARLLLEFGPLFLARAHLAPQHLERDHAGERVVVGLEDRAHAALTDQPDEFEVVEDAACGQSLPAMGTKDGGKGQFVGDIDGTAAGRAALDQRGEGGLFHTANLARRRRNVQRFHRNPWMTPFIAPPSSAPTASTAGSPGSGQTSAAPAGRKR